jgi:two-component system nitrate/nitrite response regulator NarL
MNQIKIVLADDHVLVRNGIKSLLEDEDNILVVDEASNGLEAIKSVKTHAPTLLISDIRMPEMNGIEVVKEIKTNFKNVKVLMLSMHDSEEYVLKSIDAGADGYLLKGSSKAEFLKAIYAIASGEKYFSGDVSSIIIKNLSKAKSTPKITLEENTFKLTKREKQILHLILEGKSNKEVALELDVSKRTTEVHRFNLMKKLEVKNLIELSKKATKYNLI